MQRSLLTAVLIVLAFFVGRALYLGMASEKTRIGWLLEAEAEAFNSTAVLAVLSHFALDYRDESAGVDLPMLRGAVLWVLQNRRDAQQRFLCRVELPEQAGSVTVDGDAATAEFPMRLYQGLDADEQLVWELRVAAELRRVDGDWRIARSTHVTTAGRMPGR